MKFWSLLALLFLGQARGRPESGTISGRVFTVEGTPAPGVRVSAMALDATDPANKASAALVSLTQTDSTGRYRLENVPSGNYYVTAGSLQLPTYYPGVISRSEASTLALASGAMAQGIDVKLVRYPDSVSVRGRVKNIPPQAPAGFFSAALISGELTIRTRLESNGSFEFLETPPGDYRFVLTPRGPASASPLRVRGADISDLVMELLPAVFGRVRVDDGSPLPADMTAAGPTAFETPAMVSLSARSTAGGGFRNAFVRPDGILMLTVATLGDHWINVSRLPLGYSVKEMLSGGVDLREKPLRIGPTSTDEIEITLTKTPPPGASSGVKVSGRVIDMSVFGPRSVWIALHKNSPAVTAPGGLTEHRTQTLVKPDGTFEFDGIPPGNYMISSAEFPGPNLVFVGNRDISGIVLGGR